MGVPHQLDRRRIGEDSVKEEKFMMKELRKCRQTYRWFQIGIGL